MEESPQQQEQNKQKGLMPGQEHEDELDYMGIALLNLAKKSIALLKNFFVSKKPNNIS